MLVRRLPSERSYVMNVARGTRRSVKRFVRPRVPSPRIEQLYRFAPKEVLRLPDLDEAKSAVINSLPSRESQRGYRHAIDEFIGWYCSEPRLSFNRTVVTRFRIYLESRRLAPGTSNGRLAAVRRLAYEAVDSGLLNSELAGGARRVKGPKNLGVSIGNWLPAEQARTLWQTPNWHRTRGSVRRTPVCEEIKL